MPSSGTASGSTAASAATSTALAAVLMTVTAVYSVAERPWRVRLWNTKK